MRWIISFDIYSIIIRIDGCRGMFCGDFISWKIDEGVEIIISFVNVFNCVICIVLDKIGIKIKCDSV